MKTSLRWSLDPRTLVPVGKRAMLPSRIEASYEGEEDDDPAGPLLPVEVVVEVGDDGQAYCSSVTVRALPGRPVTGVEVKELPLRAMVGTACRHAAWVRMGGGRAVPIDDGEDHHEQAVADIRAAVLNNRTAPNDNYVEAVDHFRSGLGPSEIARAMGMSRSQVHRYLKRARTEGLINQEDDR